MAALSVLIKIEIHCKAANNLNIMLSRQGRENQRYEDGSTRLIAGSVPIDSEGNILMITSSKKPDDWIFPKGGWETDETCEEASIRETLEEGLK